MEMSMSTFIYYTTTTSTLGHILLKYEEKFMYFFHLWQQQKNRLNQTSKFSERLLIVLSYSFALRLYPTI